MIPLFKNAVESSSTQPKKLPPKSEKLNALEKELQNDITHSKTTTQSQQQGGAEAGTTEQKILKQLYAPDSEITYENKVADFSAQLKQTINDYKSLTQPLLLSTLEGKNQLDTSHVKVEFNDSAMLFDQNVEFRSAKNAKLAEKHHVLKDSSSWF